MSLQLGLNRHKQKLCCSEVCKDLPFHLDSENNLKNQLLDNLLRPQISQVLLERERDFERFSSATFERCRQQTAISLAYTNWFKLGQHLEIGQKILYKSHRQDFSKWQKLQQRRLGPFTVTKRVTNRAYHVQGDKDPTTLKTVHRNPLVDNYPKDETLPPKIEDYVPMDRRPDDFDEIFMEQRIQKINNAGQSGMQDSLPFPIEPLRTAPVTAPDKTFFFLKKLKFLGHVISPVGTQPIAKRVKELLNHKSHGSKRDVMKVPEYLGFFSCYIRIFHVDSQPFYDLIRDSTPFQWTHEHEKLFQSIKDRSSEDTILAVPSTDYPFHIHTVSSNVGTSCIPEVKRIISFNLRIFDEAEQKLSTLQRELCGIVSALKTYEHYIIGSPFPIYLYCDHKPILYLWGRKGQLSHPFFRYQVIITKFQNFKIIWTPGSNLAFPDILSQNVTVEDCQKHQLQHKKIPRDIEFYDEHGSPFTYRNQHNDDPNDTCNDFYPIHCQQVNDNKVQNDGENFTLNSLSNEFASTRIQAATDCFQLGRTINQFRRLCQPSTQSLNSE